MHLYRLLLMGLVGLLMAFPLMGISECSSSGEPPAYARTITAYKGVNLVYNNGTFTANGTLTLAPSPEEGLATDYGNAAVTAASYNDIPLTVTASGDYLEFAGIPTSGSPVDITATWTFGLEDPWNGASLMTHPNNGYSSLQLTIWSEAGNNVAPFQVDGYSRDDGATVFTWGNVTGLEGLFGGQTPVIVKGGSRNGSSGVSGYATFGLTASPDYKLYTVGTTAGGVVISSYYFGSDPAQPANVQKHTKYIRPYIQWLETNVGAYPRRDYIGSSVLWGTGGCMEVDGNTYCDNLNGGDSSWYAGVHEPGHAFFGSRVRTFDPSVQFGNEGQVVSTNTSFLKDEGTLADYETTVAFLCDMVPYSAQNEGRKVVWPLGEEGQHTLAEQTMYASYYRAGFLNYMLSELYGNEGFKRGSKLLVQRHMGSTFTGEDYVQALADGWGVSYDEVYAKYAEWLQVENSVIPAEYYDYCPDAARTWQTRGRSYWMARGIEPRVHPSLPEFALP